VLGWEVEFEVRAGWRLSSESGCHGCLVELMEGFLDGLDGEECSGRTACALGVRAGW
jgi:hypothetical protein